MKRLSIAEARALDEKAQKFYNIPSACLMEVAGSSTAEVILENKNYKKVCVFCGRGNNGGDGLVVARYLINAGLKVKVYLLAEPDKLKLDPKRNFEILIKMNAWVKRVKSLSDLDDEIKQTDCIVDAIFGIGLTKDVEGLEKEVIKHINGLNRFVVSIDVPSGLNADTGKIMGTCVKANTTVTFVATKQGFFLADGPHACGEIIIKDIGIPDVD